MTTHQLKLNGKPEAPREFKTVVTHVSIFLFNGNEGKLRAVARIVMNDSLQLTGLRVYEGSNGTFVSYPNDPYYKGEEYRQLFYPVSKELRDHIQEEIMKEYNARLAEANQTSHLTRDEELDCNPLNDDSHGEEA